VSAPALEARFTLEVGGGAFTLEVDVEHEEGTLVLYGPSGSGKTLTLRALAGLEKHVEGRIAIGGEVLLDGRAATPAHRRGIGYVPQHHAVFPFRDVAENVAFGLPRRERRRDHPRVTALLDELGIAHLAGARPDALSGGERQRVALARALAVQPRLLLLDEPFASIDRDGRRELRRLLRDLLAAHGTPAVFVTHHPGEATFLAHRVALYERGRTAQVGEPTEVLAPYAPIRLRGRVAGAGEPGRKPGSLRVPLEGAQLEGPAKLLEDGELDLDLRAR
jgi:molybdate transport system ATP-binding protein